MEMLLEEARSIPVFADVDLCVLGGSCTGVFAAVRAARLGLKVALVEQQNCFGGVATISMVNVWHSLLDTNYDKQIIGGLTAEVIERLKKRQAVTEVERSASVGYAFNSEELKIELDELVIEHGVMPFLYTSFVAPMVTEGVLIGAVVENKSGRGVIRASLFVDATGDGDLCARIPVATYMSSHLQPSTTCAKLSGWDTLTEQGFKLGDMMLKHGDEFGLPQGFVWGRHVPGSNQYMLAGTRIHDANLASADSMTRGEIEGRRQVRGILDLIRKYCPEADVTLQQLPSRIGIRESRHIHSRHQLTGDEVLYGVRFHDAIANGTYRVDIHHQDKPGITFQYLDGKETYSVPGMPAVNGRWREPIAEDPTFYQIPYRSMLPEEGPSNLIVAGRMIDADIVAHAGSRVMVKMNQTGEAAGVAAYLALSSGVGYAQVPPDRLRSKLAEGGSIMV
jgi:hypothetical protein